MHEANTHITRVWEGYECDCEMCVEFTPAPSETKLTRDVADICAKHSTTLEKLATYMRDEVYDWMKEKHFKHLVEFFAERGTPI